MNLLVHTCLLCFVVCGTLGTRGSEATFSGDLTVTVTGGPTSSGGLQTSPSDVDELEIDEELSGGDHNNFSPNELPSIRDERKKKKGKGRKRNKHRGKSTTPLNPEHTNFTSGHTPPISTTENPCTSTHLGYCIHGFCEYIEGLPEPVCTCAKGYNGERCGIQTLEAIKTQSGPSSNTEMVQTVLVIIAVVLSVISCTAILLLTCAHYRAHKHFLASYLGTGSEQEKLQKPIRDVVV